VPVPLPTVAMSDIGKEKDVTPVEASAQVLNKVLTGVIDAASEALKKLTASAGGLLKSVAGGNAEAKADEAKKDLKDAAANVKDAAGGFLKSIRGDKEKAPADAQP
jgi:uncharacterized membrane protein (DUF4010 family)